MQLMLVLCTSFQGYLDELDIGSVVHLHSEAIWVNLVLVLWCNCCHGNLGFHAALHCVRTTIGVHYSTMLRLSLTLISNQTIILYNKNAFQ